jgi:uncharacterized protein YceH (UPF0502 family)
MDKGRYALRQKTLLQGKLSFAHGASVFDCIIRDISDTGARLKFSDTIATPEVMELHIPNRQETHIVRVEWRAGDELGVSFVDGDKRSPANADESAAAAADLALRLKKIEEDVAALRRIVAAMRAERSDRQDQAI